MTMTNQHTDSVLIQQMEILKGDNTMTTTPDYNDGAVHWWGADKRYTPEGLHPETIVIVLDCINGGGFNHGRVIGFHWAGVSAFQVITPHVEPRVWWVNVYSAGLGTGLYKTKQEALKWAATDSNVKTIRVVEQPESDT
jgi:hypothetical protein